jgi:hypothetical protein
VAGQLRVSQLRNTARLRSLTFGNCLDFILNLAFFTAALIAEPVMQEADTSWKWRRHLGELQDFDMLEPCTKASLKYTSRYFAVPKEKPRMPVPL